MLQEETLVIRTDIDGHLAFHGEQTAIDGLRAFFGDCREPRIPNTELLLLSFDPKRFKDDVPQPAPLEFRVKHTDLLWLPRDAKPIRVTFAVTRFIGDKSTWIKGVPPHIVHVVTKFLGTSDHARGVMLKLHCGEVKPTIVITLRSLNSRLYLNVNATSEEA